MIAPRTPVRVDVAPARYHGTDHPGVVVQCAGESVVAGVVDGVGSWGSGVEAADWARRRLEARWQAALPLSALAVRRDVLAVVSDLPRDLRQDDGGCAFSVALVLVCGGLSDVVAAGAYGVECVDPRGSRSVFGPHRWVDEMLASGVLTSADAESHVLRNMIVGPFVTGDSPADLAWVPFVLAPEESIVIAEERCLRRLRQLPADQRASFDARAVQGLVDRPVMPVVVLRP